MKFVLLTAGVAAAMKGRDRRRALQTTQTDRMGGADSKEIAAKINAALAEGEAPVRACATHALHELDALVGLLTGAADPALDKLYDEVDSRRRKLATVTDRSEAHYSEARRLAAKDPEATEALRDASCAEVLMLWAHHVAEEAKESLVHEHGVTLPTMPTYNDTVVDTYKDTDVAQVYASSYTCQTGHGMQAASDTGSDHVLPHWPKEVHYTGTGYGAYPFWQGGEGSGGHGPIEVWWSESKAAEKFYHETCYLDQAGYGTGSTPCYHLMTGPLGSAKGYLFSADEKFCCISTGKTEDLAPPQSDFMDDMTVGSTYNVSTAYYTGEAIWYTETLGSSEAVTAFWYATTPEGLPLQQGEGGYGPNRASGRGIFIYHEYNLTAWAEPADLDASIFEVPSICQSTSKKCQFP